MTSCPACGSERGFYHDVDNDWTRCLACFSPVQVDAETVTTTKAGRPPAMDEGPGDKLVDVRETREVEPAQAEHITEKVTVESVEVQPKVVKARDKAVRPPKHPA